MSLQIYSSSKPREYKYTVAVTTKRLEVFVMSAQPLNSDIKIYRSVRSQRTGSRNDSIAVIIKRLRPSVMSVPGHEIRAGALTRDLAHADFSPYCGEARSNGVRGFPIVYGFKEMLPLATATMSLPNIDFPYVIGQDQFIYNTTAGLSSDLHGDLRSIDADFNTNFVPNH